MNTNSRLLISLILGFSSLQGCATLDQSKRGETQPAENAQVAEIAVTPSSREPQAEKSAVSVAAAKEQTVVKALPQQPVAPLARYTVVAGDTLASISAKPEVYGDAKLWPLLYVANNNLIGPRGLIFPGQTLGINRNFSVDDVRALTGRSKSVAQHGMSVRPAVAPKAGAPVVAKAAAAKAVVVAAKEQGGVTAPKDEVKPAAVEARSTDEIKPAVAEAKPAAATAETAAQEVAATKPKEETRPADFLAAARRAFASGDVPWAIHYYNTYLAVQKRDANAWGELGNVYYFDGRLAESAQAYFSAANVLIDQGHTARALELMPAIEEGNPGLAEAIYLRLTTVKR